MIAEPPLAGAVHDSTTWPSPAVPATPVGAAGTSLSTTRYEIVPSALFASSGLFARSVSRPVCPAAATLLVAVIRYSPSGNTDADSSTTWLLVSRKRNR